MEKPKEWPYTIFYSVLTRCPASGNKWTLWKPEMTDLEEAMRLVRELLNDGREVKVKRRVELHSKPLIEVL